MLTVKKIGKFNYKAMLKYKKKSSKVYILPKNSVFMGKKKYYIKKYKTKTYSQRLDIDKKKTKKKPIFYNSDVLTYSTYFHKRRAVEKFR